MSATRANGRAGPRAPHADAAPAGASPNEPSTDLSPGPPEGIHLPAEWIRERGFAPGSPFDLEELPDGSLLLRPASASEAATSLTLPAGRDRPAEHLFRELIAGYLSGATELSVVEPGGLRPETRQVVGAFRERAGTPIVVSQDAEVVVLQASPEELRVPVERLLAQMFRTVREIQETAGSFLDADGPADPARLAVRDDDVDRQAWAVERSLVRSLPPGPSGPSTREPRSDPISSILIARTLERIADHAVVLGEHAARLAQCSVPDAVRSSLRSAHVQGLEYLDRAFEVTRSPEVLRANELLDTGAALRTAHRSLAESFLARGGSLELSPLASSDLGLVLQSLDRTVAYAEDLVEVALDRAVAGRLSSAAAGLVARPPGRANRSARRSLERPKVAATP